LEFGVESFFSWSRKQPEWQRPWLILGKGPSFERLRDYELSRYSLMSLNHVVDSVKVIAAHMIDIDVVNSCYESIQNNAEVLVLPWVPHKDNRPGNYNLSELIEESEFLAQMNSEGRLLYYHHLPNQMFGGDPLVNVKYFSAEAAIDLLAKAGVSQLRTLGVDGGSSYSSSFSHLTEKTLLSNGRRTFNKQFESFAEIIMNTGVDLAPLDAECPIRVFVATTEAQMLPVKVLEYSIKKHASMTVEVIPIHLSGIDIPEPKDRRNWPRTPFSFQRFLIPELAGFRGRAIYLDSDMQVFKDIKELWTLPFNGAALLAAREDSKSGRRPQFSVMLLDCGKLGWDINTIITQLNSGELSYEDLMYEMSVAEPIKADIDCTWNSLEKFDAKETSLLHYTDMRTQPWVSTENSNGYLWFRDLFEALEKGFISLEFVKEQVDKGFVRPSLLFQVEHHIEDPLLLPKSARISDADFDAAFTHVHAHGARPWTSPRSYIKAVLRQCAQSSGLTRLVKRIKARLDRG
jgi:hypothetical protein